MKSHGGSPNPPAPFPAKPPRTGEGRGSHKLRVSSWLRFFRWQRPTFCLPLPSPVRGGLAGKGAGGLGLLLTVTMVHAQTAPPATPPTPKPGFAAPAATKPDAVVSSLVAAIRDNNPAKVEALLAKDANVNATDANGSTPLMQACAASGPEIVRLLLAKGADVNARDRDGFGPLAIAAYSGKAEVAELLLAKGADVNQADAKGRTPLMGAAYSGRGPILKLLLDKGADVRAKDAEDFTALMVAAGAGSEENIRLLLGRGANVNAPTKTGFTPLMQACGTRRPQIVRVLLSFDATVNNVAQRGATALLVACYAGDGVSARLLLDRGAYVEAADAIGHTPLIGAAYSGSVEACRYLLERGAKRETKTKTGFTALMQAAYSGRLEVARLLLERGADLSVATNAGVTPLMQAAGTGNAPMLRLLLDWGADINAKDTKDQTALVWAKKRDQKEVMPLLNRAASVTLAPSARLQPIVPYIPPGPKPQIVGPRIVGATPSRPFLHRLGAVGKGPFTWRAQNLAPGLTLDPKTGIITGKIAKAGEWTTNVSVSSSSGQATQTLRIVGGAGKLALTPPMGWSAWNLFGETVTSAKIQEQADWLVKTGLAAHGYTFVLLDDTWQGRRDTQTGALGPNRRIGDIKQLADYVHAKGLKLGIYSSPNEETCAGYAGSLGHEEQDAATWAGWGVDYLKYDWCDQKTKRFEATSELLRPTFAKMRAALDKQNRDIVYTITTYGLAAPWVWGRDVGANSWWTSAQLVESWDGISKSGFGTASKTDEAGPGGFNDPGWLLLGKVGSASINPHFVRLTPDEQKTVFTVWCMASAPLILSCDLTQLDPNAFYPVTTAIITNDEVIAIDQDANGKPGAPIDGSYAGEIWGKTLSDGSTVVALFNKRDAVRRLSVRWADVGLTGSQKVRDLWLRKDLGTIADEFGAEVPAHGVVLIKVGGK